MRADTLLQRHPCCDPALFKRYDALYRGGPAFRRLIDEFLPRNPLEGAQIYDLRKRDAAYRSYVGPVIDFFAAQLFAAPFLVRAKGEALPPVFYGEFREDVDMGGTDLVSFMKGRFVSAMIRGASWILAELPDDDGVAPAARLDWEARGLGRVRLCPLDAESVLDWELDVYGALRWAITYQRTSRRDDPRLERTLVTDTWRLYDATDVETFEVTYDPKKRKIRGTDEIPSVGRKPHRFPRVPLVQLRLPEGLWLTNRAAEAQVEHFRLSAAMSWALKRTCYPMAVFKASEGGNAPLPITGPGYTLKIGEKESIEWVSPTSAAFEVLAKAIGDWKDEIYRMANQMASSVNNNATALNRSGESKQADSQAAEICLHAYGVHVREAIETVHELVSDGRGDWDTHFSVEGMTSFSLGDIATALANIQLAGELGIPSVTLAAELGKKAATLLLPDADQVVKDQIAAEIDAGAKDPTAAPPAPPATLPAGGEAPKPEDAPAPSPAAA